MTAIAGLAIVLVFIAIAYVALQVLIIATYVVRFLYWVVVGILFGTPPPPKTNEHDYDNDF